jgi:RNA polymerase sigma-70 factor (ECF subfamily)
MAIRRQPEPREDGDPHLKGTTGQSLEELYRLHLATVYRFVYAKVGNREEAEDLTSQVFVKAVRHLDEARSAESVASWLFQVARTTIADHWRQVYRLHADSLDALLAAGWQGPTEGSANRPDDVDPDQRVRQLLLLLSARDREVLTCRFLQNLSVRETAERMQLTEANVKVLQYRALRRAAELDSGWTPQASSVRRADGADAGRVTSE